MSAIGSLAMHGALAVGLRGIPPAFTRERRVFPMRLELRYGPARVETDPATPTASEVVPEPAARERNRAERARAAPRSLGAAGTAPPAVVATPAELQVSAVPSFDLSPRAVARATTQVGPFAIPSGDEADTTSDPKMVRKLASSMPDLDETAVSSPPRAAARVVQQVVTRALRPWKALQPGRSGSLYYYVGRGFDAAIMPDGEVRYLDKQGAHLTVMQLIARNGAPGKSVLGLNVHDSVATLARGGGDPSAGERRAFLEKTRALRDFLRDQSELNRARPAEPRSLPE